MKDDAKGSPFLAKVIKWTDKTAAPDLLEINGERYMSGTAGRDLFVETMMELIALAVRALSKHMDCPDKAYDLIMAEIAKDCEAKVKADSTTSPDLSSLTTEQKTELVARLKSIRVDNA